MEHRMRHSFSRVPQGIVCEMVHSLGWGCRRNCRKIYSLILAWGPCPSANAELNERPSSDKPKWCNALQFRAVKNESLYDQLIRDKMVLILKPKQPRFRTPFLITYLPIEVVTQTKSICIWSTVNFPRVTPGTPFCLWERRDQNTRGWEELF